jgi:PIN domain nuclease of toxin-antitoxin system
VKLLLDTHAVIWFLSGDDRLSNRARQAVENRDNGCLVSAVAGYEIAYKNQRGLLDFPPIGELPTQIRRAGLVTLAIDIAHAVRAGMLPGPHRDPWDRMLMAQAEIEGCTLVTLDPVFADYGVRTLW